MAVIWLAKTRLSDAIDGFEGRLVTTPEVREEVLAHSHVDHGAIEHLFVKRVEVQSPRRTLHLGLGAGETSALALARELETVLMTDDKAARAAARVHAIASEPVAYFVYLALMEKRVTVAQALEILDDILAHGWYVDTATYAKIQQKIRTFA